MRGEALDVAVRSGANKAGAVDAADGGAERHVVNSKVWGRQAREGAACVKARVGQNPADDRSRR
jgi:hypothetical protein